MQREIETDLDQAIAEWKVCNQRDAETAIGTLKRLRVAVTERIATYERLIGDRKRDDSDDEANPARPL